MRKKERGCTENITALALSFLKSHKDGTAGL